MLFKLFKHDFRAMVRSLLPLLSVYLVFTILFRISYSMDFSMELMSITLAALVTAVFVIYIKNIVGHYQQKIYGKGGLLTNTLPVKPKNILLSKLFAGATITVICFVVLMISILILDECFFSSTTFSRIIEFFENPIKALYGIITFLSGVALLLTTVFVCTSFGNIPAFKNRNISVPAMVSSFFLAGYFLLKILYSIADIIYNSTLNSEKIIPWFAPSFLTVIVFLFCTILSILFFFISAKLIEKFKSI